MQDEIELKLQAPPVVLRDILGCSLVRKISTEKAVTRRLVSTYFDTPHHTLRKSGVALRVRRRPDGFEQTVKAPVPGVAGLQTYLEWHSPVPGNAPVISGIGDREIRSIIMLGGRHKRLRPLFVSDVERQTLPVRFGESHIEMALDIGHIEAVGGNLEEVSELELELLDGDASALLELALELAEFANLGLGHLTKAERGYFLARPALRPLACRADKTGLPQDISVPQAFLAILGGTLEHLRGNEQPVAAGQPDGVHQARVAIRRLRAGLWTFRSLLPAKERKAFNQEFRWFQGQLSPARDWHVFLDETVPAIRRAYPGRGDAATRLRKTALDERDRVTDDVTGLFSDVRYTRLVLRFTGWLEEQKVAISTSLADEPVKDFAAGILDASHGKFISDSRPLSRMSANKRHALRKRGKKFRYACEFFSALWPGRSTDAYLQSMKNLQESLGVINDVSVASQHDGFLEAHGADSREGRLVQDLSLIHI